MADNPEHRLNQPHPATVDEPSHRAVDLLDHPRRRVLHRRGTVTPFELIDLPIFGVRVLKAFRPQLAPSARRDLGWGASRIVFPQGIESGHIDFVVNHVGERVLETAGKDLVFKLDGNKLALCVVGFFLARHPRLQGWDGRHCRR